MRSKPISQFGFRQERGGPHLARTILLEELKLLFSFVDFPDADKDLCLRSILEDKLYAKLLETLIYTYLGDWVRRQKQDIAKGIDGAQEKLAASESLLKNLDLILKGEAHYDIFVRWKPIEDQPIGWNPDFNAGVRLNIRPYMIVGDVKKRGAGVLRDKPNIKWGKDRGKDVASAPWYHLFKGDRINHHHLCLAEKRAAREAA